MYGGVFLVSSHVMKCQKKSQGLKIIMPLVSQIIVKRTYNIVALYMYSKRKKSSRLCNKHRSTRAEKSANHLTMFHSVIKPISFYYTERCDVPSVCRTCRHRQTVLLSRREVETVLRLPLNVTPICLEHWTLLPLYARTHACTHSYCIRPKRIF